MKLLKLLSLFTFLVVSSYAQIPGVGQSFPSYGVSVASTVNAAASVVTIQGNQASGVRLVRAIAFKGFDVTCSVACTVSLERDGAAATTTAATIVQLNGETSPSTAVAFSASNVGGGTVLAQYTLTAGGQVAVNLSGKQLYTGPENLTIRTSAITGTVNTNIQWTEN
jgi:hypothetical protein